MAAVVVALAVRDRATAGTASRPVEGSEAVSAATGRHSETVRPLAVEAMTVPVAAIAVHRFVTSAHPRRPRRLMTSSRR